MIREETLARLRKLKPRFHELGIRRMAIFGSVARDQDDADSDLDIIVDLDENFGLSRFFKMKQEVEKHMGYPVDLTTFNSFQAPHYKHILSDAVDV